MSTSKDWPEPMMGPFQNAMQAYCSGLDTATRGFDPMLKSVVQANLEVFGLCSRRAQAYLEFPSRLGECHNPPELLAAQVRFWQTAFSQYQDSSRKVARVWMQALPELHKSMSKSGGKPERDYITVPEAQEPQRPDTGDRTRRAA